MDIRQTAINSKAKVRLITGNPGVGKTYFGCQIAEYELHKSARGVGEYQKILFLTFARNAVARIRQAYLQQISNNTSISETAKSRKIFEFNNRVSVNTFAGFFWWLIGSYGRYLPNNSTTERPWFIGNKRTGSEKVPENYKGYTFEELENEAKLVLEVKGIQDFISDIYPLIIVDEFQDVDSNLFEIIDRLRQKGRLVLLCGPGQCIYRGLKKFDPDVIMDECNRRFNPVAFELEPKNENSQRYCPKISALITEYDKGSVSIQKIWPIFFKGIEPKTTGGNPKEIETQAGLLLIKMKDYLKNKMLQRNPSLCVLASTNQGVSRIYDRFLKGNPKYYLKPLRVSLHFEDVLLLQYGRLILSLLKVHWIKHDVSDVDEDRVSENLASFFKQVKPDIKYNGSSWKPLASALLYIVKRQLPSRDKTRKGIIDKLSKDIETTNNLLRSKKKDLPAGSPATPLIKTDIPLLRLLSDEFLKSIDSAFWPSGKLNLSKAELLFEKSMQKRVMFEKLGIEYGVQVMTIHKAKGREFDGVVLVLEDNQKALWKKGSKSTDSEVKDLYRVGISRAKEAFGLIAYNNVYDDAKSPIQELLPAQLFQS